MKLNTNYNQFSTDTGTKQFNFGYNLFNINGV